MALQASAGGLVARVSRRPVLALVLLTLLAWLPGFVSLPVLDRDEARFAQASKQMVESGNWVDIRFGDEARYKKPIGIYWLQAASTSLFNHPPYTAIWTYRLPSLLGALCAVLLAFWAFRAIAPPEAALSAAALLALALGVAAEAHIAKTDAVLLASTVAAQGVLMRLYLAGRKAAAAPGLACVLAGWIALAVGVLIKGPVIVAVVVLTALALSAWDRNWRWLAASRPISGSILLLLLVMPWFAAIGIASHGAFFTQALGHDFAAKITGGQESHGSPPGYYIVASTLTLWPATLAAIPGLAFGIAARKEPRMRFLLAWAIPSWLMFAIVPTKLPHYILPVYPALAGLAGIWLWQGNRLRRATAWRTAAAIQFVLGTLLLGAGIVYGPIRYGAGSPVWLVALALAGSLAGIAAAVLLWQDRRRQALLAAIVSALIFYPTLMWATAPRLTQIWLSPRLARLVELERHPDDPPVIVSGYDEPSVIFLTGTGTRVAVGAEAARIAARDGGLVVVDQHQQAAFLAELQALHVAAQPKGHLSGINYSHGKQEQLTIYRVRP